MVPSSMGRSSEENSAAYVTALAGWIRAFLNGLLFQEDWIEHLEIQSRAAGWSDSTWGTFCTEFSLIDWVGMKKFASSEDTFPRAPKKAVLVIEENRVFFQDDEGKVSSSIFRRESESCWGSETYDYSEQFARCQLSNWLVFHP